MKFKKSLLTLNPYQPGKSIDEVKRQFGLENITKLASNENPFGCSPSVREAIQYNDISFSTYPDGYATDLRETLANFLGISKDYLIFGSGSDELIRIISRALLDSNHNAIMAAPTFPQYKHNAIIEGATIQELPLVNGEHDLVGMLGLIDDKTSLIWLCSPNNPTGTYIPESKLTSFLNEVPKDVIIVLDEAYYEYVEANDYYDSINFVHQFENLIVLRTFSKIYGLASFRLGYGIANPTIIKVMETVREPFNVNTLALLAGETALKDQEYVLECKRLNREGLQQYYDFCEKHQLTYYPSQGNFILIDFKVDADKVFQYLMKNGFIVRSGKALGFPTSIRITVGTKAQNSELIGVMTEFITISSSKLLSL